MNFRMKYLAVLLWSVSSIAHANTCNFTNLSIQYNYQLARDESNKINETPVSTIYLTITDKLNQKAKQVLSFMQSNDVLPSYTCSARSYLTDFNIQQPVIDGYYGDVVIADLNFDGRDDVAIASEFTNGYGQLYKFYFQDEHGQFTENTNFITPQVESFAYPFPAKINPKNKTLTFVSRNGALHVFSATYQLNEKTGKWKRMNNTVENEKKPKKIRKNKRKYLV